MNYINKINLIIFISLIFIIELIYFYPAPNGDDIYALMLSLNLCNDGAWIFPFGSGSMLQTRFTPDIVWDNHGWVAAYIMSKINIFCNIRGIFLFNFIIKILTAITAFKILNSDKINSNKFFVYLSIFFIFLVQLKIQFRFETFAILLYLLIILYIKKEKYILTGALFGVLFYSHIMFFCLVGLFTLIFYYKKFYKNFFYLLSGCVVSLIFLSFIFEYSLVDYIKGTFYIRTSWTDGNVSPSWFNDILEFYIFTKYLPFWGLLVFTLYIFLIYGNRWLILTLPFIYYFGPRVPVSNYYLIGLTPLIIILLNETLGQQKFVIFNKMKKYVFIMMAIVTVLGYSQYFSRNLLTIYYYGNEINFTKSYLRDKIDKFYRIPSFYFLLNKDYKLSNEDVKKIIKDKSLYEYIEDNKRLLSNKEIVYNGYEAGNRPHPCPNNDLVKREHSLKLFGKKIYNSNAGYGIYVCKSKNVFRGKLAR